MVILAKRQAFVNSSRRPDVAALMPAGTECYGAVVLRRRRRSLDKSARTASESFSASESESAKLAKALGHPVRVRVIRLLLAKGGLSPGAIVAVFPLAQSTISEHLRILRNSGLINIETQRSRRICTVDRKQLRHFQVMIAEI